MNIIRTWIFALLLISLTVILRPAIAQDTPYSWNDLVAWNGQTHWTNYLIMSPARFGPNALPVPDLRNGRIEGERYFETTASSHFSDGDNTFDWSLRYYHPFLDNRIAIDFYMVAAEYYTLSAKVRDQRKIRSSSPEGVAVGDLFFGTIIQLVRERERFPDLTLEMYCKTTSGGGLQDARFTDHPAYYFNMNFGKDLGSKVLDKVRWYGLLGFYNWQTNLDDYLQNDAPSYGLGLQLSKSGYRIDNQFCGYLGYISWKNEPVVRNSEKPYLYTGDQPLVYRLKLMKERKRTKLTFEFQQGLNDFKYSTFRFGIRFQFNNNEQ